MTEPIERDRRKAKDALGELGEVTGAVEAVAQLLASERNELVIRTYGDAEWLLGVLKRNRQRSPIRTRLISRLEDGIDRFWGRIGQ